MLRAYLFAEHEDLIGYHGTYNDRGITQIGFVFKDNNCIAEELDKDPRAGMIQTNAGAVNLNYRNPTFASDPT